MQPCFPIKVKEITKNADKKGTKTKLRQKNNYRNTRKKEKQRNTKNIQVRERKTRQLGYKNHKKKKHR